jgi:cyclopropane-fatty-acyl-phospholipid synthase
VQELLRRISTWLYPGGKLFVHIFLHRGLPYHYEVQVWTPWIKTCFISRIHFQ